MVKQKKIEEATFVPQQMNDGSNTEEKSIAYVVVREGYRVSDREYETPNDSAAISEQEFWTRVANKHSYGEPISIVQYDSRKHRVW